MHNVIDFGRVRTALFQEAHKRHLSEGKVEEAVRVLPDLLARCGPYSQSRRVAFRLGYMMLAGPLHVLAPTCPDYDHLFGRYTFKGLGDGVPLLAKRHMVFLRSIRDLVPNMQVEFLVADHEADDPALCKATKCSRAEFLERLNRSVSLIRESVSDLGWTVSFMTDVVKDLLSEERLAVAMIQQNKTYAGHIVSENIARLAMYRRIGSFTVREQHQRTLATAAQYVVLGRFAERRNMAICNHTTTNLAWYLREGVAVLHNPVQVY